MNFIERRYILISDIKLLELLHKQPELDHKMIMVNYIPFIYKLVFNELSIRYTKEDIEKYLSAIFLEVFNYKEKIDSQSNFNKVLLAIMAKRKIIDMYRRNKNNNPIDIDDISMDLHTISDDVARSILLKVINSQLVDDLKSLDESDSEIITSKYSLNQRLRDISNNSGLKVSFYA
jgi:RNA polymerase sigma-70 factor, ECF subfamily